MKKEKKIIIGIVLTLTLIVMFSISVNGVVKVDKYTGDIDLSPYYPKSNPFGFYNVSTLTTPTLEEVLIEGNDANGNTIYLDDTYLGSSLYTEGFGTPTWFHPNDLVIHANTLGVPSFLIMGKGNITISQSDLYLTNKQIKGLADGTESTDAVNKGQLDSAISGIDLSGLVPYTGATSNVNLGSYDFTTTGTGTFGNLNVDNLNLNGNTITSNTGTVNFNDDNLYTSGLIQAFSTSTHTIGEWEFSSANFEGVMTNTGQNYEGRINFADDGLNALFSSDFGNWNNQGGYEGVKIGHFYNENPDNMDVMLTLSYAGNIDVSSGYDLRLVGDNDKVIFGAGQDAGFHYDGTNLIFNPKLVGSGFMKILGDLWVNEDLTVVGDINQTNGNTTINLIRGFMYIRNESNNNTPISSADNYYNLSEDIKFGVTNGFIQGSNYLQAEVSGWYDVDLNVGFSQVNGAGDEWHFSVGVDGVAQDTCHMPRKINTITDYGSASCSGEVYLNIGDKVTAMIENENDDDDANIMDMQLRLRRVGN